MADDTVIYSKRYPQEREKIRALWDQFKESEGGKEETERKLREFWEKMETESVYIPDPRLGEQEQMLYRAGGEDVPKL